MAWWLAYEELYGDMDKEYPIMSKDDVTIVGAARTDTLDLPGAGDQSFWDDDGFSVTGNPTASSDTITFSTDSPGAADTVTVGSGLLGGMGEDHISFNINPGLANTAYDDPKYYVQDFGDPSPFGNIPDLSSASQSQDLFYVNTNSPVQDDLDEVYKFHYPSTKKPQPDLTSEATQKYGEDKGIRDLKDYVSSTYSGHYTSQNNNVQTLDLIQSVGDAESFCRSNAIKYLSRYDKKGQAKRDILKAMHYCLLLYYFSGNANNETPTRGYETF